MVFHIFKKKDNEKKGKRSAREKNELTNKEISERLGISLSTVENHMYIALKQLRMSLSGV